MREVQRQGHKIIRLVGRITEHHALVTGTLLLRNRTTNPLVDVLTLRVQRGQDTATLRFELILRLGVTDLRNRLTNDFLDIHPSVATHFTGNHYLTGCTQGLAGYVCLRVLRNHIVQDRVRNLVRHLVRVSFRHRF